VALRPSSGAAHNNLGNALFDVNDVEAAITQLRKAIELDPGAAWIHSNLGHIYYVKKEWDSAAAECRKAIQLDADYPSAHNNLGNVLYNQGVLDEAIAEYRKAIQLEPKDAGPYYNLANVLYVKKDLDGAVAEYRRAIQLEPNNASTHHALGNALLFKRDLDGAVAQFRMAVQLAPNEASVHYGLGNALCYQGHPAEAIMECRKAVNIDQKDPMARYYLGFALLQVGEAAQARQATRDALELLPSNHSYRQFAAGQVRHCDQLQALGHTLDAVLKGSEAPTDPEKQLVLADLCARYKHCYVAATRLYAAALTARPALADDLTKEYRYNAACSAALAAAGKGLEPQKPPTQEQVKLRAQALSWLRADLELLARHLPGAKPEARAAMREKLENWQLDPELAGVRDQVVLAKLPQAEQEACRLFWVDVKKLLEQASGTVPDNGKQRPD
jgi:superkiller protein 3